MTHSSHGITRLRCLRNTTMAMTISYRADRSTRRISRWISKSRPRHQNLDRYHHHRQPIHQCSPERRPPRGPRLTVVLKPSVPFHKQISNRICQVYPRYYEMPPLAIQRAVCLLYILLPASLRPTSYHSHCDYDLHFELPSTPNTLHPYDMLVDLLLSHFPCSSILGSLILTFP